MRPRHVLLRATLMLIFLCVSVWGCAPKAKRLDAPIADDVQAGINAGVASFSHDALDALLKRHVSVDGAHVDYKGLKQDLPQLDAYLASVASADLKTLSSKELKALLINAYNAYTLKLIISNESVTSIRNIDDPWGTQAYRVGGHAVSLNDLEHGLLRPLFKDPRIHFAVNCASIGCPPLRPEAFTGQKLTQQLEQATKATLTNPSYVHVKANTLHLSSILDWYGGDFTNPHYTAHKASVAAYVAMYATPEVSAFIKSKDNDPKVVFLEYNWALNQKK